MDNLSQVEEQLTNPNRAVRYRAVYRLAKLKSPRAAELMANVLKSDEDRDIRAIAAKLMATYEPEYALLHIMDALRDDRHAQVRRACAEVLGKMDDALAVDGLVIALTDKSKLVRRAAVQSLRLLGRVEAVPHLVGVLLGDADSYVRWEAAKTLESLGDARAVPALVEALKADSNSYVRYASATALGELGDTGVVDALSDAMLEDENSYVRYAAARSLGYFLRDNPDPMLVHNLILALDDPDTQVWHVVAENLWSCGETVMPVVIDLLTRDDNRVRKVALKALLWLSAEFDDDDMVSFLDFEGGVMWGWWN